MMACSMMKKGLVGLGLGAGALTLAFGTSAPSYFRTAVLQARHGVRGAVPVQFEIDRARDLIAGLEPSIRDNIEVLAREEEDVESLRTEIVAHRENLGKAKAEMLVLRDGMASGDLRLTGSVSYTEAEIKGELQRRLEMFERSEQILKEKESSLKSKEKGVVAARQRLTGMMAQKQVLAAKVEEIEARLKAIEASNTSNEFHFDDSSLSRAKQSVADLDKRLKVMARVSEMEGRLGAPGVPVILEPSRDVIREIDAKFGPNAKPSGPVANEKSL